MAPQTNAQLAEIRSIALDHADYDTHALHYIVNVIDGHYPPKTDAEKLDAIRDVVDEDDGRAGIAEIAEVLG